VGADREQELQGLYQRFFVEKRLEGVIESGGFEEREREESKQVEGRIREEL
jgi:hypothetical protein